MLLADFIDRTPSPPGSGSDAVSGLRSIGKEQSNSPSVDPDETDELERVCIGRRRERLCRECLDALGLLGTDAKQ